MKRRVLHFVRKNTQLKASFINNQISHHLDFEPLLVFRKNVSKLNDGGFADFDLSLLNYLDLSKNETFFEEIRFKILKTLSKRQILSIKKLIKEKKIDICHFHYGTDCGVFYPLIKYIEIPAVVSFYGYDCSSFPSIALGYGKQYLIKRAFNLVNNVFAMSPDMKKDLIAAGCPEEKIIVHYYGTDTTRFFIKRDYQQKSTLTILILASLVPQKGHLFLLKSVKKLIESKINNFVLRIVGTGELEKELKSFVNENSLQKYVVFTGALMYASKEMLEEYKQADIFIHPSVVARNGDKEGLPGTIIEAMSAGLPVISTYHAGIPFIIESGINGILVKEYEVNNLAKAIKNLIQDKDLRKTIGLNGQKYAIEHLDLKQKETELEELYKLIINNEL